MWKELLARWVWSQQEIDAVVLAPPNHDGSTPAMAREVYHRLLARLAAIEVYYRQWVFLIAALGFALVVGGFSLSGALLGGEFLGGPKPVLPWYTLFTLVFAGLLVALPWLMTGVVTSKLAEESRDVVSRCFLREVPANTPIDLRDPWRHNWLTNGGKPLSSEITEADARSMETQTRAVWWIPSVLAAALAATALVHFSLAAAPIMLLVVIKLMFDSNPAKTRLAELETQALTEGSLYLCAGGLSWATLAENARTAQLRLAIDEDEKNVPLVNLGTTTGVLAARGDLYAPTGDLIYAFSRTDLQTHLLVFGGTGSGKTSCVLRPLAYQIADWSSTGMVVLDGKGALPGELSKLKGMRLIRADDPKMRVSLIGGLEPEQIISTIVEILEGAEPKGERFFVDAASSLLRRCAVLAKAAGGRYWTLDSIRRLATDANYRYEAAQAAPESVNEDPVFEDAVVYFKSEWEPLDERTRSNILSTALTWISQITASRELLVWAQTTEQEDTANLLEPLRGGRVGILVPGYRYGKAGAVVTALLKARIYAQLKRRADRGWGEGETPVILLIDEAQEVATAEDATMLAIGRSLGLGMVAATQTIEGVEEKLTPVVAGKWLNVYGNVIALPGRSPKTDAFVVQRVGKIWSARVDRAEGLNVRDAMRSETLIGALAASKTQESLRRWIGPNVYALGRLRRQNFAVNLPIIGNLLTRIAGGSSNAVPKSASHIGLHDLVEASEVPTLLAEPNTALVVGHRARVPRRDVVRLKPVY